MGWSAHGAALITSVPGGRFDKEEEGRPDGIRSTLVIRSADRGDFGVGYNCSVATNYGEDSFVVTLEEQSEEEKKTGGVVNSKFMFSSFFYFQLLRPSGSWWRWRAGSL